MDKIILYKQTVKDLIEYISSIVPSDEHIETQLIEDDIHGHYLLYSVGWENDIYREYGSFVHIDVKPNGKVYLQHDGTDLKVALLLCEKGIPKADSVLAFKPPFDRSLIKEFASA